MQITRKEFLDRLLRTGAGSVGVAVVAGCSRGATGGGGSSDPDAGAGDPDGAPPSGDGAVTGTCTANGTISTIASNHGHVLMVSKIDVAAGATKTYAIRGTADHPHSVTVTASMFTMLKGNTAILATSSRDSGHTHGVTVMCA